VDGADVNPAGGSLPAARALYFAYFAAMAAVMPYLALYYASAGLSGAQIGLLAGLLPLVMMVGGPLWAEFADATGRYRLVLRITIGGSILVAVGLALSGSFLAFAILAALLALCIAPTMPLLDHAVLEALGERTSAYGRQRVWGVYGWAITAPVVGWVTDRFGLPWMFAFFIAAMLAGLVVTQRVPIGSTAGRRFGAGLAAMLRDARWLPFLLTVIVAGMSLSLSLNFLMLYLREIGAGLSLVGVAMTATTLSELPVMVFAGLLLARFGPRPLLIAALLAWALRLWLYAAVTVPVWILPVQLLHGPSFGALWIAGVAYARHLAPSGAGATAQGLFASATMGLGGLAGGLFGGVTYDWLGAPTMFRLMAGLTLASALLMAFVRPGAKPERSSSRP
jgi:MFS transporter, PPP family, 3-phenylpropionic acid transporter